MHFIYLYHGDLYSYLWKSDLYFRTAEVLLMNVILDHQDSIIIDML